MNKKCTICAAVSAIGVLLCGCGNGTENMSETAVGTSATTVTTAVTATEPKKIEPLKTSGRQAYYEDEIFSVAADLITLRSSLYYPDIVHDMGANPDMFVITTNVKIKNISHDEQSFDLSGLSLTAGGAGLYIYDGQTETVQSGKTANLEVRFLCTLEQAAAVSGMSYGGEEFSPAERFVPEDFADIIAVQSADDVREHLYRVNEIHRMERYYRLRSAPTTYELYFAGHTAVDSDEDCIAVRYAAYNRSDYAQLIEPGGFSLAYATSDGSDMVMAEQVGIIAEPELMYEPESIGSTSEGEMYEMPEFLCTDPDGITRFTIVYRVRDYGSRWSVAFHGTHPDEPCYSDVEAVIAFDLDIDEAGDV